jgi:GntR family transcriptional regulator
MEPEKPLINFHLDTHSAVAPYLQLVQQVKQFLRLGHIAPGDQLPSTREVVAQLAINPNTVQKAYRELEMEGLIGSRPGRGTFVLRRLTGGPSAATYEKLRDRLSNWLKDAYDAGLDREGVEALITTSFYPISQESPEESL